MATDFKKLAADMKKINGGNADNSDVNQWLSTGFIPLDFAISGRYKDGGIPLRRITEISGPESAGKTAIATQAMISAQKMGGVAFFADHERSFKLSLAAKLGLNTGEGQWHYLKPHTFEESVKMFTEQVKQARASLDPKAPICYVFDSLPSMLPQQRFDKDAGEQGMNDVLALARATSMWFPVLVTFADDFNVCVIVLNQVRLTPGTVYGDPNVTPGGKAPKFYSSVRIQLGAVRVQDEAKTVIGSEITARCIKNKTNRPFLKATWRFMFNADGSGHFDAIGSMVDVLADKGLIEKTSSKRLIWEGSPMWRSQLVKKLEAEPGSLAMLEKMLIDSGAEPEIDIEAATLAAEGLIEA